jgi:hypothetical protein
VLLRRPARQVGLGFGSGDTGLLLVNVAVAVRAVVIGLIALVALIIGCK